MITQSYSDWSQSRAQEFLEKEKMIQCRRCNGTGDIACGCNCPNCFSDETCNDCQGYGEFPYRKSMGTRVPELGSRVYFSEVISDLKDLAIWTGGDFLGIAGEFVKYENRRRENEQY